MKKIGLLSTVLFLLMITSIIGVGIMFHGGIIMDGELFIYGFYIAIGSWLIMAILSGFLY